MDIRSYNKDSTPLTSAKHNSYSEVYTGSPSSYIIPGTVSPSTPYISYFAKAMGSHFEHDRTMESVRLWAYFPGMKSKISAYVMGCEACQMVKAGSKFEKGCKML